MTDWVALAWKGTLKVGTDNVVVPAFHTAVLSANSEENGIALSGEENTELVLVSSCRLVLLLPRYR